VVDKQVFSNAVILEGEELEVTRGYLVISGGVVKKICVEDGQPVEFGQTIIILD